MSSTSTPWRQLVKLPKIGICGMLKFGASVGLVQSFVEYLKDIIPNFPTECPKKLPYRFVIQKLNVTDDSPDASNWFQIPMANGVYRIILSFFSDDDPQGFKVEWYSELNNRMGSDVF